ncbi:MAG: hypothetical protein NC349_08260 [Paenibacillus sp.]|nr:hypothetical protein [Paenibacillus sp.]
MMTILLSISLAAILLAMAVLLLGVKVFFVKGGRFPSGHAHDSAELKRRGIGCHHDL